MWRSPTTPPDETAEAGRPRRSRWLDIVNLAVSILILAIFVRMIPLLTAGSGMSLNELAARVDNLERSVTELQAQVVTPPVAALLELSPVDAAGFWGLDHSTGFLIRNTGTETAVNVRVLVSLSSVSPAWAGALNGMEQIALGTFPSSTVVSMRQVEASAPLTSASGFDAEGSSALELAVVALPPGETLYVTLSLSQDLTARTCAVTQNVRVQVHPSRFGLPGAVAKSLEALPYAFARQLRTVAEQRERVAQFAAVAVCDNCRESAGASGFGLSALAKFSAGGALQQRRDGSLEWAGAAQAEFYAPAGVPDPCGSDARLFGGSSAFISHGGWVYLYELVPTD
jgi:hypothetical protein